MIEFVIYTLIIAVSFVLVGYLWGRRKARGKEGDAYQSEETRQYFLERRLKEREKNQEAIDSLLKENEELTHKLRVRDHLINQLSSLQARRLCDEIWQKKKRK